MGENIFSPMVVDAIGEIMNISLGSSATAVSNMLFDFQAPSAGTEAAAEAPAFLPSWSIIASVTVFPDKNPSIKAIRQQITASLRR